MNRILLLISLIISCFSSGQFIESRIAEEQVLDESLNHALIGTSGNTLVGVSTDKKSMHIDVYDKESLVLMYHEQVKLIGNEEYQLEIDGVYQVGDQFKLVVTGFSLKYGANLFGVFIYDILEDGTLGEKVEQKLFSGKEKTKWNVLMNIETNSDNSQLLVHVTFEQKLSEVKDHGLLVYDKTLRKLYESEQRVLSQASSKNTVNLSYHLGNDNHLYEASQKITYNKSIKKYQSVLELKKFAFQGREAVAVQSLPIPDGYLLADLHFVENKSDVQVIASYLSSKKKEVIGIRGIFMVKFNADLSVKQKAIQAFSKEIKQKSLVGFDNPEELDVPLLYKIKQVMTDSRGNNYVLFERESFDGTDYYYGSVIAVKITNEGLVAWDSYIPKSQFSKDKMAPFIFPIMAATGLVGVTIAMVLSGRFTKDKRQYLSYKPFLKNDELYILYNDNPENEGRRSGQSRINLTKLKESVPFMIHLSPEGKPTYQMLGNLKKESGSQRILYSVLEENILFSLNDSGKTEILQRIEFD